jgi:hypothetical protein
MLLVGARALIELRLELDGVPLGQQTLVERLPQAVLGVGSQPNMG